MEIVFDILVISGGVLGCFMSMSIACSSFFKSKANNYLSISILILSIIMVLGWLNPGTGIFEMIRAIMWEMLIPVTLLTYFLIHLKHPFFKTRVYKLLYLPFIVSFLIDVFLELDFSMNLYKLPVNIEDSIVQIIFSIESWFSIFLNAILMIWARSLIKKADIEQKIRQWLLRLNAMLLGIIFIWFLQQLGIILLGSTFSLLVIWISISILLWFLLYYGVFKLQIAIERKEIHQLIIRQKKKTQSPYNIKKISQKTRKLGKVTNN